MAVAEYMLHNREGDHRRWVPGFIGDRGHWHNPINHTYIGWIPDVRDYYVPPSVHILTKADFLARILAMHTASSMTREVMAEDGSRTTVNLTDEEVTTMAETWFDAFVAKNEAEAA